MGIGTDDTQSTPHPKAFHDTCAIQDDRDCPGIGSKQSKSIPWSECCYRYGEQGGKGRRSKRRLNQCPANRDFVEFTYIRLYRYCRNISC